MTVQSAEAATGIAAADEGASYASGTVLVTFKDGTTQEAASETVRKADTVATASVDDGNLIGSTVEGGTLSGSDPTAKVDVASDRTVVEAVAQLECDPTVATAQPDYCYRLLDEGDDTDQMTTEELRDEAASQIADTDTAMVAQAVSINDPKANTQWQLSSVDCYDAWSYAKCNNTVGVAVIDTGCNVAHADLNANVKGAYNSVSQGYGTSAVSDTMGHGTHVAGIVSARTNNGVGVSGVSYNANIIPIKAISTDGSFYTSSLVQAYKYLISVKSTYNIRVANMSLGNYGNCSSDDLLLRWVDTAYSDGILTVCAAGNDEHALPYASYPGDYDTCVSVIALGYQGENTTKAEYSNYNVSGSTGKNISAPGSFVYSTYENDYGYMSGTSMATPVVSGVAALVFAGNGSLTAAQCKEILYSTATDLGASGWDLSYGYGEVNALAAVQKATNASNAQSVSDGTYALRPANNTSLSADVVGYSLSSGANVQTYTYFGTSNQRFTFLYDSASKSYRIWDADSGLYLTAASASACANVSQASYKDSDLQRWQLVSAGSGYYYVYCKGASGMCLDIAGAYTGAGGNIQIFPCAKTSNQKWRLDSVGPIADGTYSICSAMDYAYVLDVVGFSQSDCANVQIFRNYRTANQRWVFTYLGSGVYKIINVNSDRSLDAAGSTPGTCANVQQFTYWGNPNQQWKVVDVGGGQMKIICAATSNESLDVAGAYKGNGGNVQVFPFKNTFNQRWRISG